jgi:hypothetical protein
MCSEVQQHERRHAHQCARESPGSCTGPRRARACLWLGEDAAPTPLWRTGRFHATTSRAHRWSGEYIEAQVITAKNKGGIGFLFWNAANDYSKPYAAMPEMGAAKGRPRDNISVATNTPGPCRRAYLQEPTRQNGRRPLSHRMLIAHLARPRAWNSSFPGAGRVPEDFAGY